MKQYQLGQVQLSIMKVLWNNRGITAREITDTLNQTSDIAHSTVQTLLRQLEEKDAISHYKAGRTFYYRANINKEEVQEHETRQLMDRFFNNSPKGLLSYLVEQEEISLQELQELEQLIQSSKREES